MHTLKYKYALVWTCIMGMLSIMFTACTPPLSSSEALELKEDSLVHVLGVPIKTEMSKEVELRALSEAIIKLDSEEYEKNKTAFLIAIGARYFDLKAYEDYLKITKVLRKHSYSNRDTIGMARAHYNTGNYYYFAEPNIDSAYKNYFKAQKLYARTPERLQAGKSLLSMAIIQKNEKDYTGSEESAISAIQYFDPSEDIRYLSSVYNNLGIVAKDLGEYDRAIEYHKKALTFRKKIEDGEMYEVSSLSNIGVVYANKKEYAEAVRNYEIGLSYDSVYLKRPKTYARLIDNKAYAQFKMGIIDGFPQAFTTPLHIRDSINDQSGMITSYLHLADYYQAQGQRDSTLHYANQAYLVTKKRKFSKGMLQALSILTEFAPPEAARVYAQRHIVVSDSLQRVQRSYQDQFARTRYETDTLAIEKEKATERIKLLTLFLLAALVAVLLGYTLIQQKIGRTRLRFQEEQQKASDEITNLMMEQHVKLEEGKQLEKHRISEELHDGVLARLFGIRLNLDSLNASDHVDDIKSRAKYLEDLKDLGREIRTISHELNAQTFDSKMLYVDVVEKMIEAQCGALDYTFSSDPAIDWSTVANPTKAHLYRVIQEGIQNVHKHAQATTVNIAFTQIAKNIELSVSDNGKGMETTSAKKGIGLKNMAARVVKIEGQLSLDSEVGKGTTVRVQFR